MVRGSGEVRKRSAFPSQIRGKKEKIHHGIHGRLKKSAGKLLKKNILEAPFVKEMCRTTANMYRLGWDERNGGNISYLLKEEEVAEYLDLNEVIPHDSDGL